MLEIYGDRVEFGPPEKKNKCGDPQFISFFLKGKMIVHEIKQKIKNINVRFFNI